MDKTYNQQMKIRTILLIILMCFIIGGIIYLIISFKSFKPENVEGIIIEQKEAKLTINETYQIYFQKNKNEKYEYKTSNENIATVDENGVVTGINSGTATITITSSSGQTAIVVV